MLFLLEIGHIGYQKIENFMLISTTQTCLSDKMSPQKVKIKKLISNFARSDFLLLFLLVTFLGGILSQKYVRIF
jgi:hypothetical protein